jgi:hypothetical protein
MTAATYEAEREAERTPSHPIMLTIYRTSLFVVLVACSLGALQYTGHMPGHFKFQYVLSNMSIDEQDNENQTADVKELKKRQAEAENLAAKKTHAVAIGQKAVN